MSMNSRQGESLGLDVAARIMELKHKGESQAHFGERIGLSAQVVSNYQSGRYGASLETVSTVIHNTDVSAHWLITGEGPRLRITPEEPDRARRIVRHLREFLDALSAEYGVEEGALDEQASITDDRYFRLLHGETPAKAVGKPEPAQQTRDQED